MSGTQALHFACRRTVQEQRGNWTGVYGRFGQRDMCAHVVVTMPAKLLGSFFAMAFDTPTVMLSRPFALRELGPAVLPEYRRCPTRANSQDILLDWGFQDRTCQRQPLPTDSAQPHERH
jgi:hypothetical protein